MEWDYTWKIQIRTNKQNDQHIKLKDKNKTKEKVYLSFRSLEYEVFINMFCSSSFVGKFNWREYGAFYPNQDWGHNNIKEASQIQRFYKI